MKHKLCTTFAVTSNTKYIQPGSTFVAIKGMNEDGANYIPQALAAGATTIVIQQNQILPQVTNELIALHSATLQCVPDTRLALAQLSAQAYDYPARQLTIIGITGTKGKSTTTFLTEHILRTAGYKTAMMSTIYNKILDTMYETELTTQHPDYIHAFLRTCVDRGVTHVVMEVAAQAFSLHRVATIEYAVVMFLNFSHEHGEFYATQDDYFCAKAAIFAQLKSDGLAIIPEDDQRIEAAADAAGVRLKARFARTEIATDLSGIRFTHDGQWYEMPALVGNFNVQNARAALIAAQTCGVTPHDSVRACATFTPVPGRCNIYHLPNGAYAIIDYAHNPASFEQIFKMVRSSTKQLIVVFGAGGDRDAAKRPLMGKLAAHYADFVFLTTDNPRSEDPAAIIAEIQKGIPVDTRAEIIVEADRTKAIYHAYARSNADSLILLLGKGPDEYQLVKGIKHYFSEREILLKLANNRPTAENGSLIQHIEHSDL